MEIEHGFFKSLFDFSFTEFVTTKIIKFLYGLLILFAGIIILFIIVGGFRGGAASGLLALIIAPLLFLLYAIIARVWLEIIIVVFRIAENTAQIAKQTRKES